MISYSTNGTKRLWFFNILLMQGKLYQHCAEVERQARDMFDTLIEQMKAAEGVTEQLKEKNQLEMGTENE